MDERADETQGQPEAQVNAVPVPPPVVYPQDIAPILTPERRRDLWLQTAVVLAVGVLPDLVSGLMYYLKTLNSSQSSYFPTAIESAIGLMPRSVAVSAAVLYIMLKSGEPWSKFGIVRPHFGKDIGFGLLLWFVDSLVISAVMMILWAGMSFEAQTKDAASAAAMFPAPFGFTEWLLTMIAYIANGFAEELVICGFLVTRFRELFGTTPKAIVAASLIFASYHIYQGYPSIVCIFVGGLCFTGTYVLTKRLWPCVFAHALYDAAVMYQYALASPQ